MEGGDDQGLRALLNYLHRTRGVELTRYKRSTLLRRVHKRMQRVGVADVNAYIARLEAEPDEFQQLFRMLLIHVTGFYRDPLAWNELAKHLAPLVTDVLDAPIRVWSAGCASGEEAYTIAIVIAELVGIENVADRARIFATDLDESALARGRAAIYSEPSLEHLPLELRQRYFSAVRDGLVVRDELRRAVTFGRHDLMSDAPISRVDLLSCRNTLMYFNAETRTRILEQLQFALNPQGLLFLGKAETLLTHPALFSPVDLRAKIFRRTQRISPRAESAPVRGEGDHTAPLVAMAFDRGPFAQIVIDGDGAVLLINQEAQRLFALGERDVGRPFQDLELSHRPTDLRATIDRTRWAMEPTRLKDVSWSDAFGETTYLDVHVVPLMDDARRLRGFALIFVDSSQLHAQKQALRHATLELQKTHDQLRATCDELESTRDAFQSRLEEGNAADEVSVLRTVFDAVRTGVVVLDPSLRVRAWNSRMNALSGLSAGEVVGKSFLDLDLGFPFDALESSLRAAGQDHEPVEPRFERVVRLGDERPCTVTVMPTQESGGRGVVVLFDVRSDE